MKIDDFEVTARADDWPFTASTRAMPSIVQLQNNAIHPRGFKDDIPVDLQGGRLIDMTEEEEIDPSDGATVQITTYRIETPDGHELTQTVRRKMKIDYRQLHHRVETLNGKETKNEVAVQQISNGFNTFPGGNFPAIEGGFDFDKSALKLNMDDPQDLRISNVLNQTRDAFLGILSQEKAEWIAKFPDLFSKMRTQSQLIPSTTTETVVNADGSVTTRSRSHQSVSSQWCRQETYINGVKQTSKSKWRAFVEYKGPEGGFKVKLSDEGEDELSEEENDDDERSAHSDDNESVFSITSQIPRGAIKAPGGKKKTDRAQMAARELVDSEQRYVDKLRLLDQIFRVDVEALEKAGDFERAKVGKLFSNISSLHTFHNTHLLPQLMDANREWNHTRRISHVMKKLAPFLKMYSEYTNNYNEAVKVFEEQRVKNRKFADLVAKIERLPECDNLPLSSHLICPVQRVMRYQLLLQEYKKHLNKSDVDLADTEEALQLVLKAAEHANETMKKLERYRKVIEMQEMLGNSLPLVSVGREFIESGPIQKISSSTQKPEERYLFLFNDLILLGVKGYVSKYRVRARFEALHTRVCEGDNLEREHSFYLRGNYGTEPPRCVELFTDTQEAKEKWMRKLQEVITRARDNSATFSKHDSKRSSISEGKSKSPKHCAECDIELSFLSRKVFKLKCSKCQRKLCDKCFGRYKNDGKKGKLCEGCVKNTVNSDTIRNAVSSVGDVLDKPPRGAGVLHGSDVRFKGSLGKTFHRYFAVRSDFCLYSYEDEKQTRAVAMLPLPGAEVKMCGERNSFQLRVGTRRIYTITVDDEKTQAKWMAVLDLAANAHMAQSDSE
ncbi:unnamed protein product, partial [Mesorhabditis spiculigera]